MYYRIVMEPSLDCGLVELERRFKAYKSYFLRGMSLDVKTIPVPWQFTVRPNPRHPLVMDDYYPAFHLMSQRMVDALQGAGATNLQIFSAQVRNLETGHVRDDFVVVNIVGLISCAVDEKSQSTPIADRRYFLNLVIDETRARGVPVFRLAESQLDVIVCEEVAKALRNAQLRSVSLEPVAAPD